MAVGSQAIALTDRERRPSFAVVRKVNPQGVILANISALAKPEAAIEAVDMIEADALQLHLNVPQELAMREGERDFAGMLDNISRIAALSPVPVIAKEVVFGLSKESVQLLFSAGVSLFDTGGQGGTNFIVIEDLRRAVLAMNSITGACLPLSAGRDHLTGAAGKSHRFRGHQNGCGCAKALCMGAELVGMAGPW